MTACEKCGAKKRGVQRSDELGLALCSRCFGDQERTSPAVAEATIKGSTTIKPKAAEVDRLALDMNLSAAAKEIRNYVVLTPEQADACALWAAHSHVVEAFRITPYLSVQSAVKQSGKTRLLEVLRPLTARPLDTDGMTPAALIRTIDKERPTLLLDESDASFGGSRELAEALRGILNSGFRSRGNYVKCVGEGSNLTTRKFSTYGAKAIAGIGTLPDTVADRSIPIRLRRRAESEKVREFFEEEWDYRAEAICGGFAALGSAVEALAAARPTRPEGISDRAKDAWKALLAIADLAEGEWPDRARHAARTLSSAGDVDEQEIGIRLIGAVRDAFEARETDRLTTQELLDHLHEQKDEPWADWSRGNPISPRRVADLLRPFDVKPRKIRIGEETARGYELERCEDAFERYLPRTPASNRNIRNNGSSKPETGVPKVEHEPEMFHFEKARKPHEQADVPDVPLPDADTGGKGAEPPSAAEVEEAGPEAPHRPSVYDDGGWR